MCTLLFSSSRLRYPQRFRRRLRRCSLLCSLAVRAFERLAQAGCTRTVGWHAEFKGVQALLQLVALIEQFFDVRARARLRVCQRTLALLELRADRSHFPLQCKDGTVLLLDFVLDF